jgi:hypothetical protein
MLAVNALMKSPSVVKIAQSLWHFYNHQLIEHPFFTNLCTVCVSEAFTLLPTRTEKMNIGLFLLGCFGIVCYWDLVFPLLPHTRSLFTSLQKATVLSFPQAFLVGFEIYLSKKTGSIMPGLTKDILEIFLRTITRFITFQFVPFHLQITCILVADSLLDLIFAEKEATLESFDF